MGGVRKWHCDCFCSRVSSSGLSKQQQTLWKQNLSYLSGVNSQVGKGCVTTTREFHQPKLFKEVVSTGYVSCCSEEQQQQTDSSACQPALAAKHPHAIGHEGTDQPELSSPDSQTRPVQNPATATRGLPRAVEFNERTLHHMSRAPAARLPQNTP